MQRQGTTFKLNLALSDLPTFTCLPERVGQHQTTSHLLPDERDGSVLAQVRQAWDEVAAGRLADFPTMEWYFHTDAEPSLQDRQGNHSAALFVQWVPHTLASSSWDQEPPALCRSFDLGGQPLAPDLPELIVDTLPLAPLILKSALGSPAGIFTTWTTPWHLISGFRTLGRCRVSIQPVPGVTLQGVSLVRPVTTRRFESCRIWESHSSELVFPSRLDSW